MEKATRTGAVGMNGCGIARVRLASAQAQTAAIRTGAMANADTNDVSLKGGNHE